MGSILEALHQEHKARLLRLEQAAMKVAIPIASQTKPPEPEPEPVTPSPKSNKINKINTFDIILNEICAYYDVSKLDILSDRRMHFIVKSRHMLAYMLFKMTTLTSYQMAPKMGKDCTTILYGINKIKNNIAAYKQDITELEDRITLALSQRKAIFA